jgi:NADP-dependent 3-hydroxy acid dehydrogenase YdfG
MNRIVLAYSHDNVELADQLDHDLVRIGIPFEKITDVPGSEPGSFASQLAENAEPVILLVTDNLLRSRNCLTHLLPALQKTVQQNQLLIVAADGKTSPDGGVTYEAVPTHFDRMVYALQYMNYWQNLWLDLSTKQQHAGNQAEKEAIEPELDATRQVANNVGEIISVLKNAGFTTWEDFSSNGYALFFKTFGLQEWHEPYKNLASPEETSIPAVQPAPPMTEKPVITGPLAPVALQTPEIDQVLQQIENDPEYSEQEIRHTIQDGWLWLEKGRTEQGFELFRLAMEQHPEHPELKREYEAALALYGKPENGAAPEPAHTPTVEVQSQPEPPETALPTINATSVNKDQEAKSYELMGDLAAEKGDFLFAKYCWDRTAELDPDHPGIFRKLGIMTSEHLRTDYKETAVHYLQKATEQDPNDAEVLFWLADAAHQNLETAKAEDFYKKAISIDPALKTPQRDETFLSAVPEEIIAPVVPIPAPIPVAQTEPAQPASRGQILTVLITGATSGIGRATAELFASHGHRLILTGRRHDRLTAVRDHFEKSYQTELLLLPFDVRDQKVVQDTIESLPDNWQNIDVLVNNAGLAKGLTPIQEGVLDHWETMIDTNIKGLLYVTRAVAPGMVKRRHGHIINMGSSAGKEAYPNGNVYCATKFAVDALTKAMRFDLYTHNIRVSQVSPGHVEETEFAINRFDGDADRARIYNDFQPLKAGDVADAIYYIATRPPHVNVQDIILFGTQQASAMVVDRSGR